MDIKNALRRQPWYVIAVLVFLLILLLAMRGKLVRQRAGYPKPPLPVEPHQQREGLLAISYRRVWLENKHPLIRQRLRNVARIERLLPDFARSCRDRADVVIIHQDSFAADYQDEEYALFGKVMKFAAIYGSPGEITARARVREVLALK